MNKLFGPPAALCDYERTLAQMTAAKARMRRARAAAAKAYERHNSSESDETGGAWEDAVTAAAEATRHFNETVIRLNDEKHVLRLMGGGQ
jgi:hypothetical protein